MIGDSAVVAFEPDQQRSTLLGLTVKSARKGRLVGPIRTEYGYYVLTVTKIERKRDAAGFSETRIEPSMNLMMLDEVMVMKK